MAVPALLYVPDRIPSEKAPGIVSISGHHYRASKAADYVQARNVNLVRRGCVVLSYDYMGCSERFTGGDGDGHDPAPRGGGNDHGISSFSLSDRSPTALEILDARRRWTSWPADPRSTPGGSGSPRRTSAATVTKTPSATKTPSVTKTPSATKTPTATKTPSATKTATVTKTPSATHMPIATNTPTATPVNGTLFADGFEAGSLAAWSAATTGSGRLSVTSGAAFVGTRGMQALITAPPASMSPTTRRQTRPVITRNSTSTRTVPA